MWKYQEILNADIYILLAIGLGIISVALGIFQRVDMRVLNAFVFKILLPIAVINGLGLKSDLRDPDIWKFIGAFLMLRAIWLVICIIVFGILLKGGLGEITSNWMSITWISTIILGVPTLKAALGPTYASLGIVAGISSFIFQLPVMLILYEIHVWQRENSSGGYEAKMEEAGAGAGGKGVTVTDNNNNNNQYLPAVGITTTSSGGDRDKSTEAGSELEGHTKATAASSGRVIGFGNYKLTTTQLKGIGYRLMNNYILWGLLIGLILSVSEIGPKYLEPTNPSPPPPVNCDYVIETGFIVALLGSFAACVEPTALFTTGMFMARRKPIALGPIKAFSYMVIKLILVPAIMIGCAKTFGLSNELGRAAVLIAALPISAAASVLSKTYNVGDEVTVTNVFLGNLLILPTTLLWLEFMDGVDLFTVTPMAVPDTCAVAPAPKAAMGPAAAAASG